MTILSGALPKPGESSGSAPRGFSRLAAVCRRLPDAAFCRRHKQLHVAILKEAYPLISAIAKDYVLKHHRQFLQFLGCSWTWRRWSCDLNRADKTSWTEVPCPAKWLWRAGKHVARGASSNQVSFQKSVLRPSLMLTLVMCWYAGSKFLSASQCVPARSPCRESICICPLTQVAQAEPSGWCRWWMSFRSRLAFCVLRRLIPSPPSSLGWHTFSQATRHWAPLTLSDAVHKKALLLASSASQTPGKSKVGVSLFFLLV